MFTAGRFDQVIAKVGAEREPPLHRLRLMADSHYNLQQWQPAVAVYRKILAREPGQEMVVQYLADSLSRLNRYDEAIRLYRVLADRHPDRPGYWKVIGDLATAKGDDEVALASYSKAVQRGYDNPDVQSRIDAIRARMAADP